MGTRHFDAHTIATIRHRHKMGDKISHLAEHYNSTDTTIRHIIQRKTYSDVPDSAIELDALQLVPRVRPAAPAGGGVQLNDKYAALRQRIAR